MLGIVPYQGHTGIERAGYSPVQTQVVQRPATMWEWYRQMRELEGRKPESTLQAGVNVVRHNAESAALAALLGFIQGEFGLDIRGVPLDGIGAVLLALLSVQKADDPTGFGSDLRALSQTCTSVYFYRISERWRSAKKTIDARGEAVPESMNIHTPKKAQTKTPTNVLNDPILEAGKRAGL